MLPPLPPEIFDLIIDHLHNEPITLKACCLVSKSWVPRSRNYIFARVDLSPGSLKSWTKTFPNLSNSPAHHTRNLHVRNLGVLSADICAWICSFRHVQELSVTNFGWGEPRGFSYLSLHGLSPTLKSLHLSTSIVTTISEIVRLICSFPLLEDLSLHSIRESETDAWIAPPTSPRLTGSLRLKGKNHSITRRLLELPDGLHFSKIRVRGRVEEVDPGMITDIVSKCSGTLETLYLKYHPSGATPLVSTVYQSLTLHPAASRMPSPLNLSNAMKLKYLNLRWGTLNVRWITVTIQTARSKILRRITIFLRNILLAPTEATLREWHELDHLLVQLWTSRSIISKILYKNTSEGLIPRLLPELTRKGFTRDQGQDG